MRVDIGNIISYLFEHDIITEIELYGNDGDKEYSMVIVEWVKIDRAGNLTIKGKTVPDSKTARN